MKKNLTEELKRIMEIMGNVENLSQLSELNVRYLDQLLDKVSSSGMESLSDYEKNALQKLSNDEDANPPEVHSLGLTNKTLRFTGKDSETGYPLVNPKDNGKTFGKSQFGTAYLHGEAHNIAGFDEPIFIDGDLGQLDKPEKEQDVRMILPQGEYDCVARAHIGENGPLYFIMLRDEEDEDYNLMEQSILDLQLGLKRDKNEPPSDKDLIEKLRTATTKRNWMLVAEVTDDLINRSSSDEIPDDLGQIEDYKV